jgi:hypothetical protein
MSGRLNDIEQRARGATPGPWFVVGPPWNEAAPYINAGSDDPHAGSVVCDFIDRDEAEEMHNSEANAEFVAAAREDVPWLLAELRRTQTALEAWLAWSGGQYPDESPGALGRDDRARRWHHDMESPPGAYVDRAPP